jgi:energy-coupling factor transporter ATP-binding protein EcfA2
MQLTKFAVEGLFGTYNHDIVFPTETGQPQPSLVILYGRNGVGKTTVLAMIDGLMRLDFNVFRRVPFARCSLHFTNDTVIRVEPQRGKRQEGLAVSFRDLLVRLHPTQAGPFQPTDAPKVEAFRTAFFSATEEVSFELIDTARMLPLLYKDIDPDLAPGSSRQLQAQWLRLARVPNPKSKTVERSLDLAGKVQRFVSEAQANYRRFFATTEPDLFPKIIQKLTAGDVEPVKSAALLERLRSIRERDERNQKVGLEPDRWDYAELRTLLQGRKSAASDHALVVIGAYIEALESRCLERSLVADRLLAFESLIATFFVDKRVVINPRKGFDILSADGVALREDQLSSGEYHLLYLMVTALVTQRRGTIIAIDEPEMSMHLSWQRKLIRALLEVASKAEPQFLLATHSPDIAGDYPDALLELGADKKQ